jgi:hypothetical protein
MRVGQTQILAFHLSRGGHNGKRVPASQRTGIFVIGGTVDVRPTACSCPPTVHVREQEHIPNQIRDDADFLCYGYKFLSFARDKNLYR